MKLDPISWALIDSTNYQTVEQVSLNYNIFFALIFPFNTDAFRVSTLGYFCPSMPEIALAPHIAPKTPFGLNCSPPKSLMSISS